LIIADGREDGGLQDFPRQQAALLTVRRQPGAKQLQHIIRSKLAYVIHRFALNLLHQHRRRGLADAAAIAVKPGFLNATLSINFQLDLHDVTAQGIVVLVPVGTAPTRPAVIGVFVMIQDVFLVEFFFVHAVTIENFCSTGSLGGVKLAG
jgi:hypothetical protein